VRGRPTVFEIALPEPTLDSPLLFQRHAERMEDWLRDQFPASSGYHVSLEKEADPKRLAWQVRVDSGWFSGANVVLRPDVKTPHRAEVDVQWDSRFQRLVTVVGGFAGVPVGLLVFVAGVLVLRFYVLVFFLLIVPLIFVWLLLVALAAAAFASAAAAVFGNEFTGDRRAQLALGLKGVPLET
jgi:hypothetical protein